MKRNIKILGSVVAALLILAQAGQGIERRKNQSSKEFEYAFVPYVMQLPGIGTWVGVGGGMSNMLDTETDFYLATMSGDLTGYVTGLMDLPILSEHFTLNYFRSDFTRASIQTYGRGIDSDPKEFQILIADKIEYNVFMANLKFWEKRFHFYASRGQGSFHLDSLLDKDGEEIAEVSSGDATYQVSDAGMVFDYTDDLQDPRKGLRFEARRADSPREDDFEPLYYRLDYNVAAYFPVGSRNTWVFNYFQSDAVVQDEGETDRDAIKEKQGIDCSLNPATETECTRQLDEIVDQVYANNKYGTASSLGGVMNMRSYPQGRFYAAHTMFYGTEFRWNLTEEFTPFDIFLAKGIRTSFQVAFFWEKATLADEPEEMGKEWIESYGTGFRMVLAGGFIFRLDVANGNEGLQTQLFLNYPWGLFN